MTSDNLYSRVTYITMYYEGQFYVRRVLYLMKTAIVNANIMHIFVKIELLSIHAT